MDDRIEKIRKELKYKSCKSVCSEYNKKCNVYGKFHPKPCDCNFYVLRKYYFEEIEK